VSTITVSSIPLGHVWHEGQSHRPAALRQKR
jgi:hypothetical protein